MLAFTSDSESVGGDSAAAVHNDSEKQELDVAEESDVASDSEEEDMATGCTDHSYGAFLELPDGADLTTQGIKSTLSAQISCWCTLWLLFR